MKIGFLRAESDEFVKDVISKLKDFEIKILSFRGDNLFPDPQCRVIIDRYSYDDDYLTEMMKTLSLGGAYVINNPFSANLANKVVDMKICDSLGIPRPKTFVLPLVKEDEDYEGTVKEPDLDEVVEKIDLPCILKPHNGFGWDKVFVVNTVSELKNLYDALKSNYIMLAQEKIEYENYYRCFCVGGEVLMLKHIPRPNLRSEFHHSDLSEIKDIKEKLTEWTVSLNRKLDFDFNTVEWAVDVSGKPFIIDAFNEVPEINRSIPEKEYDWIVNSLSDLIRKKANSDEKNRTLFN